MKVYMPYLVIILPVLIVFITRKVDKKWFTISVLLFVNLLVWVTVAYHGRLILNLSDSNSHYILLLEPDSRISRGDYIVWNARHPLYFNGESFSIHKQVECMPGQILKVNQDRTYYCDGQFIGQAKTKSMDGRPLKNFVYNGIIPDGKFFTIGHRYRKEFSTTVDDSFDSRYLGFVDKKEVKGVAKPII